MRTPVAEETESPFRPMVQTISIESSKVRSCVREEMSHPMCRYRDTAVLFLWRFRVATMIHGASGFSGTLHGTTSLAVAPKPLPTPYGITRTRRLIAPADRRRLGLIGNICLIPERAFVSLISVNGARGLTIELTRSSKSSGSRNPLPVSPLFVELCKLFRGWSSRLL